MKLKNLILSLGIWLWSSLALFGVVTLAYADPASLELFSSSATSISGPTVAPQTATVRLNTNNPNDDNNTPFTPTITATISFNNQVYNNVTGAPNGYAMMFGGNGANDTDTVQPYATFTRLNAFGGASNNIFTATAATPAGTGISATNNYGTEVFISTEALQRAGVSVQIFEQAVRFLLSAGVSIDSDRY